MKPSHVSQRAILFLNVSSNRATVGDLKMKDEERKERMRNVCIMKDERIEEEGNGTGRKQTRERKNEKRKRVE